MPNDILKCRNLLTGLWAAALLVCLPASATANVYRGLDDKPADPDYAPARVGFDCTPADSLTLTVGASVALADSVVGRAEDLNGYPCAPWAENGPEIIYRLDIAADMELSARLGDMDGAADLDLFLLNDCDTDSCLVGANTEFRLNVSAGVHFLVVDTTAPLDISKTSGAFTLTLTSRPQGVPTSICADGGALPIACEGETITLVGEDLFDKPDLIREYACGTSPKTSGENWYRISQPGEHAVTINLRDVSTNLDLNMWLFAGCGPTAECLQFVDQNLGSAGESLVWTNESEEPVVAYLGVDAVRPPSSAAAGSYTIDFQCQTTVPTVSTSFGALKALYR